MYGGDPRAALIQYTKNEEARRAISSIEAVLDNRFICVYWHREPDANSAGLQQQEQSLGNQGPGATPGQGLQHINMHKVSINGSNTQKTCFFFLHFTQFYHFMSLQGIKQHNAATYVLNNIPPKHQQNATAGPTNPSKTDNLTPTSDTATVCFSFKPSDAHSISRIPLFSFKPFLDASKLWLTVYFSVNQSLLPSAL